jgi:hypothetical protein
MDYADGRLSGLLCAKSILLHCNNDCGKALSSLLSAIDQAEVVVKKQKTFFGEVNEGG